MSSNEIAETEENMNNLFDEYTNVMSEDSNIPVDNRSEIEKAKDEGIIFGDTTVLKDDLNNNVTIPGGFHVAEDSGIRVEEGIVIEDGIGNQFVWIPVGEYNVSTSINVEGKLTNNLSRRTFSSSGATEVNGDDAIDSYYYGEGNSSSVAYNTINNFKESANNNEGFYIGRYEAGTEVERTSTSDSLTMPLVQANKNAYVYVTRNQAKTQSEAMYSGNSYVTSELISSYAWDTALNFICQNSKEGYLLATTTDSTYGNIGTGLKTLTGKYKVNENISDYYCNIYDLLGNCWEWTTEYSSRTFDISYYPAVYRGGTFGDSSYYAAYRGNNTTSLSGSNLSFRLQIYINI